MKPKSSYLIYKPLHTRDKGNGNGLTARKIIRRLSQMQSQATRDFNKCPTAVAWDKGYEKGYDVAIRNVIQTIREMFKDEKETE